MKVGDTIYCTYQWKILEYVPPHWFRVSFRTGESEGLYKEIPIYMSRLYLYLRMFAFCRPGNHLPKNHPDYLEYVGLSENHRAVYSRENTHYYLDLLENFHRTGRYRLTNKRTGAVTEWPAVLKTNEEYEEEIQTWAKQGLMDGSNITGIVVGFKYNLAGSTQVEDDKWEIVYTKEEAEENHVSEMALDREFPEVIFQDSITHITFSLPIFLMRT